MFLIYTFFKFSLVHACLWDSSIDPAFLDSNPIEVCINAPDNEISERTRSAYNQASQSIRNSFNSLEARTILNFQLSSEYCDSSQSKPTPRVRVQLVSPPTTSGQAVTDLGFPYAQTNIIIPFLNEEGSVRSQSNLDFLTQHEMLHLLGIQHDDRSFRGGILVEKRRREQPEILELSDSFNTDSIMNIAGTEASPLYRGENFRDNMQVSNHDIECIRSVYRRRNEIRLQETQPNNVPSAQPAIE